MNRSAAGVMFAVWFGCSAHASAQAPALVDVNLVMGDFLKNVAAQARTYQRR